MPILPAQVKAGRQSPLLGYISQSLFCIVHSLCSLKEWITATKTIFYQPQPGQGEVQLQSQVWGESWRSEGTGNLVKNKICLDSPVLGTRKTRCPGCIKDTMALLWLLSLAPKLWLHPLSRGAGIPAGSGGVWSHSRAVSRKGGELFAVTEQSEACATGS